MYRDAGGLPVLHFSGDSPMKQQSNHHKLKPILVFVIGMLLVPCAIAGTKGLAYVSNQDGGVTVIDLESMETKNEVNVGAQGPRGIGITANGKWLVTANKGDGNISVIDTSGLANPKFIAIGKNPEFVRLLGDSAYITYEPSSKGGPPPKAGTEADKEDEDDDKIPGRIAIVDLKKSKVVKEIIGKPETEGVEFYKDGKKLIVTNESGGYIQPY